MFRKIGDALSRFMSGRYGTDSLNKALLIATAGQAANGSRRG